jgi:hypothetical protein
MPSVLKGTRLETFEQLVCQLEQWSSFADSHVYDSAGMMALLCACLNNLSRCASKTETGEFGADLQPAEREVLESLLDSRS